MFIFLPFSVYRIITALLPHCNRILSLFYRTLPHCFSVYRIITALLPHCNRILAFPSGFS